VHAVQPVVSLTFDNGPTANITERVLDILKAHDITATFFVVGSKLAGDARPASVRAVGEGHRLGCHTWSHTIPFGQADDQIVDSELSRTSEAVAAVGGDPLLFRPYGVGGATDERLMSRYGADRLRAGGYTCVLWNSVPGDWHDADGWLDRAVDDVTSQPWTVVALHDLPVGAADRLDEFVDRLEAFSVQFSQDTPDECTPIRAGAPTSSFAILGVGDP
jgi:peptidoglycan/xylan/chitin deacetylase (PgdA/CDA1 family)